jgi:predicted DCC family thiol-disulfide oxidoreductase YuxK
MLGRRDWQSQLKLCASLFALFTVLSAVPWGWRKLSWHSFFWGLSLRYFLYSAIAAAVMSILVVYVFPWCRRKYRWFERREAARPGPFDPSN